MQALRLATLLAVRERLDMRAVRGTGLESVIRAELDEHVQPDNVRFTM
jgi:hypothetical protein